MRFTAVMSLLALALLLSGCPKQESGQTGPRGRWAGQENPCAATETGEAGNAAAEPADSAAGGQDSADEAPDDGRDSADSTEDDGGQDQAAPDQPCDAGQDDDADQQQDTGQDEQAQSPPANDSKPSVDLSGKWMALFGREPSGVKPELWKSARMYNFSGNEWELHVTPVGSSMGSTERMTDIRLRRSGPFLVIDRGNQGSTAYMLTDEASTELAAGGNVRARIGGASHSGSLRLGSHGIIIEMDGGVRFDGKESNGAWCGFLEAGSTRGYCVLTSTGNNRLEGILFKDPYMAFETGLSFELDQEEAEQ